MAKSQPTIASFFSPRVKKAVDAPRVESGAGNNIDVVEVVDEEPPEQISEASKNSSKITSNSPMETMTYDLNSVDNFPNDTKDNLKGPSDKENLSKKTKKAEDSVKVKRPSEKYDTPGSIKRAKPQETTPASNRLSQFSNKPNPQVIEDTQMPKNDNLRPNLNSFESSEPLSTNNAVARSKPSSRLLKAAKLTPLEKQVIQFKKDHQDKILAIQVGYKFKFFGPDAVVVARILNIMLVPGKINIIEDHSSTGGDDEKYDRIAYCSIPDNRLHVHLQRLLDNGLKIGVIKQTETAAIKSVDGNKSSLFSRELTAVYTRATYMDDEMLTMGRDFNLLSDEFGKFILCVNELKVQQNNGIIGIVAVLPSTGEIVHDEFEDGISRTELETRLTYLTPSEVVVLSDATVPTKETMKCIKVSTQLPKGNIKSVQSDNDTQYVQYLLSFFETTVKSKSEAEDLVEFYLSNFSGTLVACVAELIKQLQEFNLSNIFTVKTNVAAFSDSRKFMLLPGNALDQLEVFKNSELRTYGKGSLIWILNHTRTKMGQRLLCKWLSKPLVVRSLIEERLLAITDFQNNHTNRFIESLLLELNKIAKVGLDIDKSLMKIHYTSMLSKQEKIGRKETFLLLQAINSLFELVCNLESNITALLSKNLISSLLLENLLRRLLELAKSNKIKALLEMINGGAAVDEKDLVSQKMEFFKLKDGEWPDIEYQQSQIKDIEFKLETELKAVRKFLKRPQLQYITNVKESYLIEVRNGVQTKNLPANWLKVNATKSVSRFRTPEIAKLNKMLQYHQDMLLQSCERAYREFLGRIDSLFEYISDVASTIAQIDCLASLTAASVLFSNGSCRPHMVDDPIIDIDEGRNPIIESVSSRPFIPNDVKMSHNEGRVLIITGPNMGGKSSYVRQIALLVIMAQVGCYLPCKLAKLGVFDAIFTRMGAQDNIIKGESTFMVEMQETASIIKKCTERSLVILDEIGRGTGTTDGISLAHSILHYFVKPNYEDSTKAPLTLFITHYPSLSEFEDIFPGIVKNYHMGFVEENTDQEWADIVFLYTLEPGVVQNLYGLNVARLAGIPNATLKKAYFMAEKMKNDVEEAKDYQMSMEAIKLFTSLQNIDQSLVEIIYERLRKLIHDM